MITIINNKLLLISLPWQGLICFRGILLTLCVVWSSAQTHAGDKGWIAYDACVLQSGKYFDGDSFNQVVGMKSGGKRPSTLNWRLYGIDCPETDQRSKPRVQEQAKYFRLREDDVLLWGKKASEFSRKFLATPFMVHTLRQKSKGDSDKPRYYAIIIGGDGRALHEVLVEEGLARAYGMPAPWPEGRSEKHFTDRLKQLERSAKAAKKGIWGSKR